MKIIAHGIDLVECQRVEKLLNHYEQQALDRLYTAAEQDYCRQYRYPVERYSARFAVKEAVMKALGTGWSGDIKWTDIETRNQSSGQPEVVLAGGARRQARSLGIERFLVSISHTSGMAMASVIGISEHGGED